MKRFLARHIWFEGVDYGLSVAQFPDDFSSVEIFSFSEEIEGTSFIDGVVSISKTKDRFSIERNGHKMGTN